MDTDRWRRIELLFDLAADLSPDDQSALLARECGEDADLLREVNSLLARDRSRKPWIAQLVEDLASIPPPEEPDLTGRRIGAYRLVREIGRGGQGVVFEATRDDDQFHQRVALKLATRAAYSNDFLARFRHERQILAQLQHPHIARLLDGGTADDGTPFFAMEYVEGVPIHVYAGSRQLPVEDRLRLFLQVCDAVEYAHQNLVIHRDLKPSNILVADGTVRLLDFGIAKLIDAAEASQTQTGLAPVTPDYCSPEQVRGLAVTTRTDVYSLGLVLFELLTGERAQQADTTSPLTLDRSICEGAVEEPSARAQAKGDRKLARRLRGDLDTIVLTAAHKDAARRYGSVVALAEDVRRHLEAQPIRARQDSRWYRAVRFGRRHWKPLATSLLLLITLVAGIVSTTYQARRAERRFQQVRSLANALIVDVHGAIIDLPGSTKARELVVQTAVEYLDGLAAEAGGDRALRLELARGYRDVALLAYSMTRPSLGRAEQARAYYSRAQAILDPLLGTDPNDPGVAAGAAALQTQIGDFLGDTGSTAEGVQALERAIAVAEAALQQHPGDIMLLEALREAHSVLLASFASNPVVRARLPRLLEVAEECARRRPDAAESLAQLGVAYAQAGKMASEDGAEEVALQYLRRNADLQTQVVSMSPENATARRNLMLAWSHLADLALGPLGSASVTGSGGPAVHLDPARRRQALEAWSKAVEQAEWLFTRDPGNETVIFDYAICLGRQAPAFPPGDPRPLVTLGKSVALLEQLAPTNAGATTRFLVEFRGSLAERYRQAGQFDAAQAQWAAVDALLRQSLQAEPDGYYIRRLVIPIFQNWAMALRANGDGRGARALALRTLQLAEEVGAREAQYARAPGWPARVHTWLAELHASMGEPEAAARARARGREMWAAIAVRPDLPPDLLDEARRVLAGDRQ